MIQVKNKHQKTTEKLITNIEQNQITKNEVLYDNRKGQKSESKMKWCELIVKNCYKLEYEMRINDELKELFKI